MIDIAVSTVIDFFQPQISSSAGVIFFALIGLAFAVGQYFVLSFVRQKTNAIRSSSGSIKAMDMGTLIIQYALIAIFVIMILQMILAASYSSILLTASVTLSYSLSIALLGVLSYRLLSWYKLNRNSFVLLYGLAAAATTVNGILALAFFDAILVTKPAEILAGSMPVVEVDPSSVVGIVQSGFKFSSIASFALLWAGSVLLIRQYYYQRLGRKKYWIIASAPLVYLITYFVTEPLFSLAQADQTLQFYYFIFFSFWNVAGGMIFGAAFLRVGRSVKRGSAVKDYMFIAGCGLILLFVSGSATVIHNPYPPFGFATTAFVGLSSYMLLLGLYSSAVSISQDTKLRISIRRSAFEESKLLDKIGSAEMEQELQRRVMKVVNDTSDKMKEQSGVEPYIAFGNNEEGKLDVLVTTSRNLGVNYASPINLSMNLTGNSTNYKIGAGGDNVYLIFENDGIGKGDIFYVASFNAGETWNVYNLSNSPARSYNSTLTVDEKGDAFVAWVDEAEDGGTVLYAYCTRWCW